MRNISLIISATISTIFGILHCFFPWTFNWHNSFPAQLNEAKNILFSLNWIVAFVLLGMTVVAVSLLLQKKARTRTEQIVLWLFAGFFVLRIVCGPLYFGFSVVELVIWILCGITAAGFVIASCNGENVPITN